MERDGFEPEIWIAVLPTTQSETPVPPKSHFESGFLVDRNSRNFGGLARRSAVCEQNLPRSAPEIPRRSQPAKFRFPDQEMERPEPQAQLDLGAWSLSGNQ